MNSISYTRLIILLVLIVSIQSQTMGVISLRELFESNFGNATTTTVSTLLTSTASTTPPPIKTSTTITPTTTAMTKLPSQTTSFRGCGYRGGDKSLYKADMATALEFPWMVALILNETTFPSLPAIALYKCGGSLIAPNVIITAAHCIKSNPNGQYFIRAGEWKRNEKDSKYPIEDILVQKIIKHPNFNNRNGVNDLALIILNSVLKWNEHIAPICLPPADKKFDNNNCYVNGWGREEYDDFKIPATLKKINVPIVPFMQCEDALKKTVLGEYFRLNESFICAGGELNKDACLGDGGSPLVCPMNTQTERYYLAGAVSWGLECGNEGIPGVYSNIVAMRQWILITLQGEGIELELI